MTIDYLAKPIYRMIHIDNVKYVLEKGMCNSNHPLADRNYINIGDLALISQRTDCEIGIDPPGGFLGEFIPFYFAGHSPMLLNIKTGHRGITKRPQSDIVFLVSSVRRVIRYCPDWCFTDGHAKNKISTYYNDAADLCMLDWKMINEQYWHNTDEDMDRQRRKAAEFLVKNFVPSKCIRKIYVFNKTCQARVQHIIDGLSLDIEIEIDNTGKLYY